MKTQKVILSYNFDDENREEQTKKFYDFLNDETNNLILNMGAGLSPEHLSEHEVNLLIERYGENWFEKLGYDKDKYKKPNFQKGN